MEEIACGRQGPRQSNLLSIRDRSPGSKEVSARRYGRQETENLRLTSVSCLSFLVVMVTV